MPRKRIADSDPAIPQEAVAAKPAKAPLAAQPPAANKARAPRASAKAVTHRHKKAAEPVAEPASVEETTSAVEPGATFSIEATVDTAVRVPAERVLPTAGEVAFRAYLIAESRGFVNGSPEEDWYEAERQLAAAH